MLNKHVKRSYYFEKLEKKIGIYWNRLTKIESFRSHFLKKLKIYVFGGRLLQKTKKVVWMLKLCILKKSNTLYEQVYSEFQFWKLLDFLKSINLWVLK